MDVLGTGVILVFFLALSVATGHKTETGRWRRDATSGAVDDLLSDVAAAVAADDLQAHVGVSVHAYVTDRLEQVSALLSDLSSSAAPDPQAAARLVHTAGTLGYLLGLDMQPAESRRLAIGRLNIYVSRLRPGSFRGLHFASDDGKSSISVPYSAVLPAKHDDVISVAYSASDITTIMPKRGNDSLVSDVLRVAFLDHSGAELTLSLPDDVIVDMTIDGPTTEQIQPECVYRTDTVDSVGLWSGDGCHTEFPVDGATDRVRCHCTKIATFSVVLSEKESKDRVGVLAWVGCSLTILFCVLTALVFIGYRLMHSVRCYIRFSFLTALAMAEMLFLCVTYREAPAICTMVAVGAHFFVTASFTWLLSYALFLGNDFIGGVEASLQIAHYTFIGWAIPFVVVLITLVWRYDSYTQEDYCWISQTSHGLRYAYIIPIAIVIVVTLSVIMYDIGVYLNINDTKKKFNLKVTRSGLRSCSSLLPILSVVWILADFLIIKPTLWLQAVFCLLNFVLGVMIFLIMFYFNEEVMQKRKGSKCRIRWGRKTDPSPVKPRPPGARPTKMTMVWGAFTTRRPSHEPAEGRVSGFDAGPSGTDTAEGEVRPSSSSRLGADEDRPVSQASTSGILRNQHTSPVERPSSRAEIHQAREQFFDCPP